MLAPWTGARGELADPLAYSCAQHGARLDCDYRLLIPGPPQGVTARVDTVTLPILQQLSYPQAENLSALLFLIDDGSLRLAGSETLIPRHVTALAEHARPHHRIGLATFHGVPNSQVALGASIKDLANGVQALASVPAMAPAYRAVLEAIQTLAAYPATRRVLVFFSAGQAAEAAYYHADIIASAREAGVILCAIAYSSLQEFPQGLSALQRLTRETGGVFASAPDADPAPIEAFARHFYDVIDSGGRFGIDLAPALNAGLGGARQVQIGIALDGDSVDLAVPVTIAPAPIPAELPATAEPTARAELPATAVSESGTQAPAPTPPTVLLAAAETLGVFGDGTLWFAGLLLAAGLLSTLVYIRYRHKPRTVESDTVRLSPAYLLRHDADKTRIPLDKLPWRIGRGKDNDTVIADSSVSRYHAEVWRTPEGHFAIKDLDSLNGLFVNNRKVHSAILTEGAEIDIGDIRFTFSIDGRLQTTQEILAAPRRLEQTP
ncbi:MAG: FHA domain-containing protein [Gammaproteobacteria bacterium]